MLTCDVTDAASVDALVSAVLAQTGRIDVLVNNVWLGLLGGAEESSIAQVQALFDVNLFGVMRVTNAVLLAMRERGGGRIINMSSVLGLIPAPYSAHYAATKHALEGYSESLDHEVRAFNIRVSLVVPAYTQGVFDQSALEPDGPLSVYEQARANAQATVAGAMQVADLPTAPAQVVVLAATTKQVRSGYTAGKVAQRISTLRRFAPAICSTRAFASKCTCLEALDRP